MSKYCSRLGHHTAVMYASCCSKMFLQRMMVLLSQKGRYLEQNAASGSKLGT
jgi:hypothetical protein